MMILPTLAKSLYHRRRSVADSLPSAELSFQLLLWEGGKPALPEQQQMDRMFGTQQSVSLTWLKGGVCSVDTPKVIGALSQNM